MDQQSSKISLRILALFADNLVIMLEIAGKKKYQGKKRSNSVKNYDVVTVRKTMPSVAKLRDFGMTRVIVHVPHEIHHPKLIKNHW